MPISPGSVPQQDTLIGPLIAQLTIVAKQVSGVGNAYAQVPEMPPEHNSVLFAPKGVGVKDDETNAKLVLAVEIELIHLFTRKRLQDNLALVFAAIPAWLHVLSAWSNQTLGGEAQNMNIDRMQIAPYKHGQQDYLALVVTLTVRTLQNIDMTA